MSLALEDVRHAADSVGVAEAPEGLSAIHHPGCAAAIWWRNPLPSFQSWIDALEPEHLPEARMILRPEDVRDAAFQICEACRIPECEERGMLIDDAAALADLLAGVMSVSYVRLRFDVVTTDACRKFHIDTVTARLVCTYRGTGTQYGISTDGTDPERIFTVPTGVPILLRGTLWPEHPTSGLLHRSPPIAGAGETRLVLVLDPISDPDNEADQEFTYVH